MITKDDLPKGLLELTEDDEILLFVGWRATMHPDEIGLRGKLRTLLAEYGMELTPGGSIPCQLTFYCLFDKKTRIPRAQCNLRIILDDKWSSEGSQDINFRLFEGSLEQVELDKLTTCFGEEKLKRSIAITAEMACLSYVGQNKGIDQLKEFDRIEGPLHPLEFVKRLQGREGFKVTTVELPPNTNIPDSTEGGSST